MRFMILRKADAKTEAGIMPSTELLGAMGKFMEEMGQAGILLDGDGLKPSAEGARVTFSNGKPKVMNGPFGIPRELLAGYCIIQVKSKEEAVAWAKRWPVLDGDGNVELEIRPYFEADDFGAEFTPEMREKEDKLRAELSAKQKAC